MDGGPNPHEQRTGELRASEARLRAIGDANPDGIVIVDEEGYIRFSNPAASALFGRDAAELAGAQFGFPVNGAEWSEVQVRNGSGVRWAEMRVAPVEWEGRPAWLASLRDVTGRRTLEEQFRQAQKLDAVGALAGGVAHDFNNLLTVIIGYAQILLQNGPQGTEPAREILSAAERAAALTRQLLAFSRRQMLVPRIIDLNALCAGIQRMLSRLAGEKVEVRTELRAGLGLVRADASQLEQVIVNLATNSRDAMPSGGAITLRTANVEMEDGYKTVDGVLRAGSYVMLEVSDTGRGMNAAMMSRIFEPFFTTKEFGQGIGMGLPTVYGIVKQSGGEIAVESEPGQGTVFRVYLPRVTGEAGGRLRPAAPASQPGARQIA